MKTKIRLQVSWLLNDRFKLNADGLQEKHDILLPLWNAMEAKVISGLEEITGLTFLKNYIDVFLINPDEAPSISFPVIVKASDNHDKTIRTLIHELIHNIMWDNQQNDNWSLKVQKLYPSESPSAARHVAVHAILEAVYLEILRKPEEIQKDIQDCQKSPNYKRAWEIVKEEGYKNVIAKLRK